MSFRFGLAALAGVLLGAAVLAAASGLPSSTSAGPFTFVPAGAPRMTTSDQGQQSTPGNGTLNNPGGVTSPAAAYGPSSLQAIPGQPIALDILMLLPLAAGVLLGVIVYRVSLAQHSAEDDE